MGWTSPRTWVAGEIVTAALANTHWRDNLRYLKGLDGVLTAESGLIIDNSGGDEYLKLPLLSTAECTTVLAAEGQVAHDEQTHRIKFHNGTAIKSIVSTNDVDDTPVNGADTDPISSNWAFDHLGILSAAGDIPYATAAGVWDRLPIGTNGQTLRVNAGATAPEWTASVATKQFTVPFVYGAGGDMAARGNHFVLSLATNGDVGVTSFRLPADFATLTSAKVVLWGITTGTFDWTVTTSWGKAGELYDATSDSATADGQAATTKEIIELDISAAFTGVEAGDVIGVKFTLDVLTTTTAVDLVGLDIKYA